MMKTDNDPKSVCTVSAVPDDISKLKNFSFFNVNDFQSSAFLRRSAKKTQSTVISAKFWT